MIKTTNMMLESLKDYANPKAKLARMVKNRECFPIVKGLYETERNVPAHLLAGSIYGPSYISFEYALGHYGLIPERVVVVTCATFEKKKKKRYETLFGTFSYRDVPAAAFPLALRLVQEGEYFYRIRLYAMSFIFNRRWQIIKKWQRCFWMICVLKKNSWLRSTWKKLPGLHRIIIRQTSGGWRLF